MNSEDKETITLLKYDYDMIIGMNNFILGENKNLLKLIKEMAGFISLHTKEQLLPMLPKDFIPKEKE